MDFQASDVLQLRPLFWGDIAVTGCLMLTVLIAACWLHLQGSVVQFFIGYLTFEDEATVWSQTGAKQTPSFRVHYPRRMKISLVAVVVVVVM